MCKHDVKGHVSSGTSPMDQSGINLWANQWIDPLLKVSTDMKIPDFCNLTLLPSQSISSQSACPLDALLRGSQPTAVGTLQSANVGGSSKGRQLEPTS